MKKFFKTFVSMLLLISTVLCTTSCGQQILSQPEKKAVKFIESMYNGDAQTYVNCLSDEVVEEVMEMYEYKTEELLVYALNKEFLDSIEEKKTLFGKKWKYDISVIDSYELDDTEEFGEYEIQEVCLKVEHTGRILLLFKRNETEEFKVIMIKKDNEWFVLAFDEVTI